MQWLSSVQFQETLRRWIVFISGRPPGTTVLCFYQKHSRYLRLLFVYFSVVGWIWEQSLRGMCFRRKSSLVAAPHVHTGDQKLSFVTCFEAIAFLDSLELAFIGLSSSPLLWL
jgi:hypothetical protein